MNTFLVFGLILCVSTVFSTPVPAKYTDEEDPVEAALQGWKKLLPELKFRVPRPFDSPAFTDPFFPDNKNFFDDFKDNSNFFEEFKAKFLPTNITNSTNENTREVDGHIIHEKETTFANDDPNNKVVFREKTVVVRPKYDILLTGRKNETPVSISTETAITDKSTKPNYKPADGSYNAPKNTNYVPRSTSSATKKSNAVPDTSFPRNPDDEVEMVQRLIKAYPTDKNVRVSISNSLDDNDEINPPYDLSNDTRVNENFNGTVDADAEIISTSLPRRNGNSRENPNELISEAFTNDLDDMYKPPDLKHDTDINEKTPYLTINTDAEIFDPNSVRKRPQNKYFYYT